MTADWVLLVATLPGSRQAARMRLWRAVKATGAAVLRDGVYLLPDAETGAARFGPHAEAVRAAGGSAYVLPCRAEPDAFSGLFDRGPEYAGLLRNAEALRQRLTGLAEADARREWRALQRGLRAVAAVDFFPGEAGARAAQAVDALEAALRKRFSPDEPVSAATTVRTRDRADYQGRRWATRRRLWVDRVASAWLIRRFIDPDAQFLWLAAPGDCPPDALGFDFDGAAFTHVGERVTFEVLLESFGLAGDAALVRLAALVHDADVGGPPQPETAGLEAVLTGVRARSPDDDALLAAMTPVLDALHTGFTESGLAGPGTARPGFSGATLPKSAFPKPGSPEPLDPEPKE